MHSAYHTLSQQQAPSPAALLVRNYMILKGILWPDGVGREPQNAKQVDPGRNPNRKTLSHWEDVFLQPFSGRYPSFSSSSAQRE
jgi:hypothetical protein